MIYFKIFFLTVLVAISGCSMLGTKSYLIPTGAASNTPVITGDKSVAMSVNRDKSGNLILKCLNNTVTIPPIFYDDNLVLIGPPLIPIVPLFGFFSKKIDWDNYITYTWITFESPKGIRLPEGIVKVTSGSESSVKIDRNKPWMTNNKFKKQVGFDIALKKPIIINVVINMSKFGCQKFSYKYLKKKRLVYEPVMPNN